MNFLSTSFCKLSCIFLFIVLSGISAATAQEEFELTFEGRWFASIPQPGSAHFSEIVGATHNDSSSLFSVGQLASAGVEDVAELGSTGTIESEINTGIADGNFGALIEGGDTFIDPEESNTFRFFATDSHSRLSFLTMIAPSPDWFVGIHDLDLQDGSGNWRNRIVLDLSNYDAGTENGSGFSLNNSATNPQGVIAELDIAEPSGALFGSGSIARVTITRVNAIPEPGSLALLGASAFCLAARRHRKQSL